MAHEKLLGISVNYTGNDTSSNTDSSTSDNLSLVVDDINTNLDYQDIPIHAKSYSFYKAAMGLNLYYSPMLIVVGFLGNSLSLVVMLQRNKGNFPVVFILPDWLWEIISSCVMPFTFG